MNIMQTSYNGIPVPTDGQPIEYKDGTFTVPDHPIIPFIEGDGTGRDIWKASQRVFDAAVEKAYGGKRSVKWYEVLAGEKAFSQTKSWLPDDTVKATVDFRVSIKGPLTTPVGGGIRSLNVALRQLMDLYQCIRPVKYYAGVPSPVKRPDLVDIVIFRENTEDIYAGIEFQEGTPEAAKVISFLNDEGHEEEDSAGLGDWDQADFDYGIEAAGACGDCVCAEGRAQGGDAGA
jgi:isocitrate dehydrogenase